MVCNSEKMYDSSAKFPSIDHSISFTENIRGFSKTTLASANVPHCLITSVMN